jgi:hypothetical protein
VKGKNSSHHAMTPPPGVWTEQFQKPKPADGTGKGKGKGNLKRQAREARRTAAAKGSAKGGTKSAAKAKGCSLSTPEGKPLCFAFNAGGCTANPCRFLHACGKCYKMGTPMSSCGCH